MRDRGQGISGSRSRRPRMIALTGMLGLLAVGLSGCTWQDAIGMGWPTGATDQAQANYGFWLAAVITAYAVGAIVFALLFWTTAFHRRKATDTELPRQFGYNMPLELVLTVIPFVIISVLFYFTVQVQDEMVRLDDDPEVVVDVTAFQWNWKFGYQSVNYKDGSFTYDGADPERKAAMVSKPEGVDHHGNERHGAVHGKNPEDRSYLNFDRVETLGTSNEIPVLVIPAGKRVEFELAAADVVHSFWVPEFLFKRDVMPHPAANNSVNRFQISGMKEGPVVGRCAEMCGTYHAMMNFEVLAVSPDEFKTYLQKREEGLSNADALIAIDKSPVATLTHPFPTRRGEQAPEPKS